MLEPTIAIAQQAVQLFLDSRWYKRLGSGRSNLFTIPAERLEEILQALPEGYLGILFSSLLPSPPVFLCS